MVAWFFGPRLAQPASTSVTGRLHREDAVWVGMTSALPIKQGDWPIVVRDPTFAVGQWPLSDFVAHNPDQREMIELRPNAPDGEPDLLYATLHGFQTAADHVDDLVDKVSPKRPASRRTQPPQRKNQLLAPPARAEHAVLISFDPSSRKWLGPFETKLAKAIPSEAGELDGHEVSADGRKGTLFLYGPSAAKLWKQIEPVVRAAPFMKGATVCLRSGPPGARERKIVL